MTASLRQQLEHERPDAPLGAAWRKNPVREHARSFMAFFLELSEGAIEGQGKIPDAQLSSEHIKKYAGAFLGMDPKMLQLNLGYSGDKQEPDDDDPE